MVTQTSASSRLLIELRSRVTQLSVALVRVTSGLPAAPDSDVVTYARMEVCMATGPVVIVGRTGADGQMVWWYPDQWSADRNHLMLLASARGVEVHTRYLHEIPADWLEDANSIYRLLRTDPDADVSCFASDGTS